MLDNKFDVGIQWPSNISTVIGPGRPATEKLRKDRTEVFLKAQTTIIVSGIEFVLIGMLTQKRAIRRHCPIVSYSKT